MASQDELLTLQKYQRTLQLIKDHAFEKESTLTKAVGAENQVSPLRRSQSWIINRTKDSLTRNDMTLIHDHLEVMTKVDPANVYYSNLLHRVNTGEHISWTEFEKALDRFISNHEYVTELQDQVNNLNLKVIQTEETPPQTPSATEPETPPVPQTPPVQLPTEPAQHPQQDHVPHIPQTPHIEPPETPHLRIVPDNPYKKPLSLREQLKTRMKKSQTSETGPAGEPRPKNTLPRRSPALSAKTRKKVIPKLTPRLGAAAALGGGGATAASGNILGNLLGARGAMQIARSAIGKIFPNVGRLIGNLMPEKLIAQGIRGLVNVGANFGRAAFDGLIKNTFNLAPRIGVQAAGGVGRGLLFSAAGTSAAIVTSAIFWWVIAFIGLFTFIWWWDQFIGNSECDKPTGEMRIVKRQGGIGSSELDPDKIEASVPNGQKIDFVIEASYQLACRTRTLSSVVVTDRIPEGTEYIEGSAISGFYQTNGEPIKGVYDSTSRTLTWSFTNFPMSNPVFIYFSVQPNASTIDTWVMNQASVRYTEGGRTGAGGTISVQSATLQAVIDQAAQRVGMDPALMKAFLRVEAPQVLNYTEEEFKFFSTPGWWEGLEANASSLKGNDPTVIRGYAYNTCAYTSCAPGADVRGVAQFEARTWSGVASQLQFDDGHEPDRRNATDAIFGSALHNRQNAEIYTGTPDVEWTEDVIRAAGRVYCAGPAAARNPARVRDSACMQGGVTYDDLLWQYYQEYSGGGTR